MKKLLGVDLELQTPGDNAKKTVEREEALDITLEPEMNGKNARRLMLAKKTAHGSGVDLDFPGAEEIEANMKDYEEGHKIQTYGDGSYTTPTKWWAALGGYGVWIPDWNKQGEAKQERSESNYYGPAIGQTGSSTRQELMAWIRVLALPYWTMYATGSASMLAKARELIAAAKTLEEKVEEGAWRTRRGKSRNGIRRADRRGS